MQKAQISSGIGLVFGIIIILSLLILFFLGQSTQNVYKEKEKALEIQSVATQNDLVI